jgi:putative cell wall-binding protein
MFFNTAPKPTVKVTTGDATVAATVHYVGTTTGRTATGISFQVTAATSTTTKRSTFSVSTLSVNTAKTVATATPLVTVFYAKTAGCATVPTLKNQLFPVDFPPKDMPTDPVAVAFHIGPVSTQIYGQTADATAVAELEAAYRPGVNCPNATVPLGTGTKTTVVATQRAVVLARDTYYSDALASQYLAGYLNTGTLLTPTGHLSTLTADALIHEGINKVYVVGGPLAISTTVTKAIQAMTAHVCGGGNAQRTPTHPTKISVTRIYGPTEYATAEAIDQHVPRDAVGTADVSNAYAGVNATKGDGMFNDTAGTASTAPAASGFLRTAILATGTSWFDAESSSVLSYRTGFPIILTTPGKLSTEALDTIVDLDIQQIVLMGGPLAITNTVATALQAMTVTLTTGGTRKLSVLRVAGKTYGDTSTQLASFENENFTTLTGLGWDTTHTGKALVARGTFFTDGLAGAVLDAPSYFGPGMPLLLTKSPTVVGTAVTAWLKKAGPGGTGINKFKPTDRVKTLTILGGPLAESPANVAAMVTDLLS